MILNGINPLKVKIYFDINQLDPKEDIIFNFAFTTLDSSVKNNNKIKFNKYNGIVVTHLTHYLSDSEKISSYLKTIKHSFLVAENNLTRNPYFKKYFPDVSSVYILPFTYSERFKNNTSFDQRINKCFAVGTLSWPKSKSFITFFGEGTSFHPMREKLYNESKNYENIIDSHIFNYDDTKDVKTVEINDSLFKKILKKILPYFILEKIFPNYRNQYFKFNIVEKFNNYKMFTSPEEIIGLPSINFVEGMACGCAFIGIDDPMYSDIGLKNGIHYIGYEKGNFDEMIDKIRYYLENQNKLSKIATTGYNFVINNFNDKKIADTFWNDLENLLSDFNRGKGILKSSFLRNE